MAACCVAACAAGGSVLWATMCGATPGAWLWSSLFMSIRGWILEMLDTPVVLLMEDLLGLLLDAETEGEEEEEEEDCCCCCCC